MSLRKRPGPFRDATLHIIATEGEKTEPWYFEGLDAAGFIDLRRVRIEILPSSDGLSAPAAVLARLDAFVLPTRWRAFDRRWVVVDVDRWPSASLHEVHKQATASGWFVLSNPCFEVWLQLHFTDRAQGDDSQSAKAAWSQLRANVDGGDWPFQRSHVQSAVQRAKAVGDRSDWPAVGATRVYRLVEELLA